jgi:hypothetical protein
MKNSLNLENSARSEGQFLGKLEPWTELVDGAILLTGLTAAIRQYVVLEGGAAEAVALRGAAHSPPLGLLDLAATRNHLGANSPSQQAVLLRLAS